MKRKILCLAAGFGLAATTALAAAGASSSIAKADEGEVEWRHYEAVKATETSIGSREYWVSCASHEVVYEAPTGENDKITDATHESDYLSYLATQGGKDARYTAYTPNAFKSEGNFWRYFRHNGWGDSDYANGSVTIKTNAIITYKLIQDAHELGINYVYFHAFAKGKTETIGSLPIIAENTTGTFSNGQTWEQDIRTYGTGYILDIDEWYTTFTGDRNAENVTAFNIDPRNSDNHPIEIDAMTFSDFACFDTSEAAEAYKGLSTLAGTNGWDYFHHGVDNVSFDGTSITYNAENEAQFQITKKTLESVKAIGKTKMSFDVKMSATDTSADLSHIVVQSEFVGGTNENGETVNSGTYVREWDVTDFAGTGTHVEVDLSKFFGDNVTFNGDLVYRISGRIKGTNDTYKPGETNPVKITISNIKVQ